MLHEPLTRRNLFQLTAAAFCGGSLWALEAPAWRRDVSTPPHNLPQPKRALAPLLVDESGNSIDSLDDWRPQAKSLRAQWQKYLGTLDRSQRPSEEYEIVSEEVVGNLIRQKITYLSEPDLRVPAYLLFARQRKPNSLRPGIVALHPTTAETIQPIAGLSGPEEKQSAIHLAEAGFVVLCPENFLWQNAESYDQAVENFQKRHPGSLGMSKMLWDAQRAVDILSSVPGVNPHKIGTFGHSLGAKEVLYLTAFDERVKATVFSEGGIAFESTNWDAPWYLGQGIHQDDFSLNHHQLLALCAPRPFLVLAGEEGRGAADGDRSWPCLAAAQEVYALYGQSGALGLFNHRQGHAIPLAARRKMIEWLTWGLTELD
ncbi:MAG: dienelactone hydrolase family protein [Planctomycetaceae bacterium]|nr:dienelactone hydrolase family protein [Planctomycetaceae bacterium]